MNAVYEYLFMGIVLVVIFGASVEMVGIISVPMQGVSDRQELQVTGEKIMGQILSKGSPANWGDISKEFTDKITRPDYFGLVLRNETTRQTYVLDANKVQRLNLDDTFNPFRLDPKIVSRSLNLGNNFGFAIQVRPVFAVNVTREVGGEDVFNVNVHWQRDGFPVANAKVTAQMIYASVSGSTVSYGMGDQQTSITGVDGKTLLPLDFRPWVGGNPWLDGPTKVLVVIVDHLGVKTISIVGPKEWGWQAMPAYRVGNHVLVGNKTIAASDWQTIPESNPTLFEILAIKNQQLGNPERYDYNFISVSTSLRLESSNSGDEQNFKSFNITNAEPVTTGVFAVQKNGVNYLAYLSRETSFSFSTSTNLNFKFNAGQTWTEIPPGVRLDRLVSIDDSLHYVQLYLWRLSH